MNIPFVDLRAQYNQIKSEIDQAIQRVIEGSAFIRGEYVDAFEKSYAAAYGTKHCISVANGTDAIYITLKMLGIGCGDEVITVANSWISTSETISQTGAKPVFVDVDQYYSIDVSKIKEKITSRTKAIIPVHLYGQPAEIDKIKYICNSYNLLLIEDCAQAHFAEYHGQKVGTFGIAGTFSFYPSKNLGAYGDAGAIVTNDDELAMRIKMYANHGALRKHHHEMEGINSRMDGLQAAILLVKLSYIHDWNRKRYEHALFYNALLKAIPGINTPKIRDNTTHVLHLYVIRTQQRSELQQYLDKKGIQTAIHYPVALPFMNAYAYLKHKQQDFPIAYQYQNEILSLPMYPELLTEQIAYIAKSISDFFTSQ